VKQDPRSGAGAIAILSRNPNNSIVIPHVTPRSMIRSTLAYWFAFAASWLVPLSGLAQKKPRILFITHGQAGDSFWAVVRKGAETAARETDCDLQYQAPERFDLAAMSRLIDSAVALKPDGLIVSIPDATILGKSIQAALTAKIPVVSVNSGLEVSRQIGCMMHIGQEEETAGRMAGERSNYAKHGAIPQNGLILTGPSFVTPENVDRVANLTNNDSP
jgi:ABC-type sugar transport system substrate-binding protein